MTRAFSAAHPNLAFHRVPNNLSPMITDEGAKKRPYSRHPMGFGNVPMITELSETEDAGTVVAFGVGGIERADGHVHGFNEVSRELCLEVAISLQTVWGAPCK